MFVLREHLAVHSAGHIQWERFCSYVERSMVCESKNWSKVNIELYRLIKQGLILCTDDTHIAATLLRVSSVLEQVRKKFSSHVVCVFLDIAFSELTLRLRIYISTDTEITTIRYRCIQKKIRNCCICTLEEISIESK